MEWQSKVTDLNQQHFRKLRDHERQTEARYQLERSRQEAQMAKLRVGRTATAGSSCANESRISCLILNAIQGLVTSGRNADAESHLAKFAKMMRHTLEYSELEEVTLEQEIEFSKTISRHKPKTSTWRQTESQDYFPQKTRPG
ncbi:MAG: histidine kinase [Saprospiraceae bacterium]